MSNPDFTIGFEENGLNPGQDKACEQKNRRRIQCNTPRTLLRTKRSHGQELETFYQKPIANSGFNPQARWDRSLPGDDGGNAEAVEVVCRFYKGKIIPLYFVFKDIRFDIRHIHYSWAERKGKSRIFYFNVADKDDNYCLFLDAEAMSWRIRVG